MNIKILIGYPHFYDWGDYILLLQKIYPQNIIISDFEKDDIVSLISKLNISHILCLTYADIKIVINLKIKNCEILNNLNYDVIDLFDNKGKFTEYFMNNNLNKYIPETYKIKYDNYIYDNTISYPSIIKTTIGEGGKDVYIINNDQEYMKISGKLKKNYIVQEYLKSNIEYVGHLFYINGELIYSLFFKIINNNILHIRKGPSKKYELVEFYYLKFDEIFKKLNYTGPLNLNFKYIDNKIKIFEVNPRFGGSIIKSNYLYDLFNTLINHLCNKLSSSLNF